MTEFGVVMEASPGYTAKLAGDIEAMGFDYLLCPDTQNLSPDPYGQLTLAAANTSRLHLGTGVTNPITRDVTVTATAILTLQQESSNRAICVIGRGDSSLAHIGKSNATTEQLRIYVQRLRDYMRGDAVQRGDKPSSLRWLDTAIVPPVPIDVACTGPKTIKMAADVADRVSFAVGSAPERIAWALETLHSRLRENGRDPKSMSIGAFINLVCDPDEQRAIDLARMISGMVAHFAGMKNVPTDHLPPQLKKLAIKMQSQYDMGRHAQEAGSHLTMVDDDFVDWFSICGSPEKCVQRLKKLTDMGLDHVYILGGSSVPHPHGERQAAMIKQTALFAEQVMPCFKKQGNSIG